MEGGGRLRWKCFKFTFPFDNAVFGIQYVFSSSSPSQDGDIIAPELTPQKPSWSNNNEGEGSESGGSTELNCATVNGQKKAKVQLFK